MKKTPRFVEKRGFVGEEIRAPVMWGLFHKPKKHRATKRCDTPVKTKECPLKRDELSIGNTSSNHRFSGDICLFSGE